MPRGRTPDYDARIQDLLTQLRAALVAREQARVAATVEAQMAGLIRGIGGGSTSGEALDAPIAATAKSARRRGWSSAARAAARARMKAYWAGKRKGAAK